MALALEYFRSMPRYVGARIAGRRAPGLVAGGPLAPLRLVTHTDPGSVRDGWARLKPALAGIIVGTTAALAAGHVMASLLYGVGARDPVTFVAVPLMVVSTVVLACVVPARRASLTSPAVALRAEQL